MRPSRPRLRLAALTAVLLASLTGLAAATLAADEPSVDPAVAPDGTVTALDLVAAPASPAPGASVTLTATVTPNPGCGSVVFTYDGTASAPVALDGSGVASLQVTAVVGELDATADFAACDAFDGSSDSVTIDARHATTTTLAASRSTAVRNEQPVTFTATVTSSQPVSGDVTFVHRLSGGGETELGTTAIASGKAALTVSDLPVGSDTIVARFLGTSTLRPSSSGNVVVTITADTVRTSGVGVQWLKLYPVTDGYKDTDQVRGTTLEPATVNITIVNSGGTSVKSWALGTITGAYAVTWNGRRADGTLLPAGTYTVKQSFKDAAGSTKTVSTNVSLSWKKLYWYVAQKSVKANTGTFSGSGGSVGTSGRFSGGVVLYGGTSEGTFSLARYTFTLPDATVYQSVRASIYGQVLSTAYGTGGWRYRNYLADTLDGGRIIGYARDWYADSITAVGHVSPGQRVQVYVHAVGDNRGALDIGTVRLTYKYAILK